MDKKRCSGSDMTFNASELRELSLGKEREIKGTTFFGIDPSGSTGTVSHNGGKSMYASVRIPCLVCGGSMDLYYRKRTNDFKFTTHYRKEKGIVISTLNVQNG